MLANTSSFKPNNKNTSGQQKMLEPKQMFILSCVVWLITVFKKKRNLFNYLKTYDLITKTSKQNITQKTSVIYKKREVSLR